MRVDDFDFELPEGYEPPTQEQLERIDNLIRLSKVAQMRGQKDEALRLLKEAESVAPYASAVLEAIGDELMAARQSFDDRGGRFDADLQIAQRRESGEIGAERSQRGGKIRRDAGEIDGRSHELRRGGRVREVLGNAGVHRGHARDVDHHGTAPPLPSTGTSHRRSVPPPP